MSASRGTPAQQLKHSIASNRRLDLLVGSAETLTISGIFSAFVSSATRKFLDTTGHYILFPAAGLINLVRTGVAVNQARLEKGKNGTKERAVMEIGSTVLISTAVIGGLAEAPYAKFAPHMFTVMLSSKTLFHFGAACYYYGKEAGAENEAEQVLYNTVAKVNAVTSYSFGVSAVATLFVMVLSQTDGFSELGIVATFLTTLNMLHAAYKMDVPSSSISIEVENDADVEAGEKNANQSSISPNSTGIYTALGGTPPDATAKNSSDIPPIATPQQPALVINETPRTAYENWLEATGKQSQPKPTSILGYTRVKNPLDLQPLVINRPGV